MTASEAAVQAAIRLEYARRGYMLYRNNVGALLDRRGVPVRYGLANESKAENERFKSGDLIGWRSFIVPQEWVGHRIAQFVSIEVKEEGWAPAPPPLPGRPPSELWLHEEAQRRWAALVAADGGVGEIFNRVV